MSTSTTARLLAEAIQLLKDMGDSVRYPKVLYGQDMRLEKLLLEYELHTHVEKPAPPTGPLYPPREDRCVVLLDLLNRTPPMTIKRLVALDTVSRMYRVERPEGVGGNVNGDLLSLVHKGQVFRYRIKDGTGASGPYYYTTNATTARNRGAFEEHGLAWGNKPPKEGE